MAYFHMEGEALLWFQDADEASQFPTRDSFTQSLLIRFGHAYDDPMESSVKLHHTSMVAKYIAQFESLSNCLCGLSDKYKLKCFLSGLIDEIRLPLRMLLAILCLLLALPNCRRNILPVFINPSNLPAACILTIGSNRGDNRLFWPALWVVLPRPPCLLALF
jgi:hypothetical protein